MGERPSSDRSGVGVLLLVLPSPWVDGGDGLLCRAPGARGEAVFRVVGKRVVADELLSFALFVTHGVLAMRSSQGWVGAQRVALARAGWKVFVDVGKGDDLLDGLLCAGDAQSCAV